MRLFVTRCRIIRLAIVVALALPLLPTVAVAQEARPVASVVAKASSQAAAEAAAAQVEAEVIESVGGDLWRIDKVLAGNPTEARVASKAAKLAARLEAREGVAWATPLGTAIGAFPFFAWPAIGSDISAFPFFAWPDGLATDASGGVDIAEFFELGGTHTSVTGSSVTVAVLDTGFELDHPFLQTRFETGIDFADGDDDPSAVRDGIDSDGDGLTDEAWGHGTFISGVIAQIAPEARILPVRVLDSDGFGESYAVIAGIDYAIEQQVDVINISFGTSDRLPGLKDAIGRAKRAGVLVVAAAGNDGTDTVHFPAGYGSVLSVGAYDQRTNEMAGFANYGSWIDVGAPGVNILSTAPGNEFGLLSGSSMSSPVVAAAAALVLDEDPTTNAEAVRQKLIKATRKLPSGVRGKTAHGLIDIRAALETDRDIDLREHLRNRSELTSTTCESISENLLATATSAPFVRIRRDGSTFLTVDMRNASTHRGVMDNAPSLSADGFYSVRTFEADRVVDVLCTPATRELQLTTDEVAEGKSISERQPYGQLVAAGAGGSSTSACERARAGALDLSGTDLSGCHIEDMSLIGADLRGAELSGAVLRNVVLDNATAVGASFDNATISHTSLRGANLRGASLAGVTLVDVDLQGAVTSGADFSRASLVRTEVPRLSGN